MINVINKIRKESDSLDNFKMVSIRNLKSFMIGVDQDDNLIFMVKPNKEKYKQVTSSRGRYLDIFYDMDCEISYNGNLVSGNFTILSLKTKNSFFEIIFLSICENLVNLLGDNPLHSNVVESLENLRDLFRKTLHNSSKTEIGLWGELFVIESSNNKELLIDSWHKTSNQTFDFNDGDSKVEVKTTTRAQRVHSFSLNQLEKAKNSTSLIYSIITSEIDLGLSVLDLYQRINKTISPEYKFKLDNKIFDVAGSNIDNYNAKFDYVTALNSRSFFSAESIPSINKVNIPNEISNVKFEINFERVKNFESSSFEEKLHKALI